MLLASERLPRKHSKTHNLPHVLSLLSYLQKSLRNVDVIVHRQVYRYKWGEADQYEFYMEDPVGVGYVYPKWYKTFQHVWTRNPTVHFHKKYLVSLKVNLNTADKTFTFLI